MAERVRRANNFWTARAKTVLVAAVVVFLALGLTSMALMFQYRQESADNRALINQNDQRLTAVEAQNDELGAALDTQIEASVEAGAPQVVPDSETIRDETPVDIPSPIGPTDRQVRDAVEQVLDANPQFTRTQIIQAVTDYLVANPPEDGEPGANATPEMVATAVAGYCLSREECQGEDGEDAPPVTEEQILAQVDAYCAARNNCMGSDGANATDEQVGVAVAAYCAARDECIGRQGNPGDDGQDGLSVLKAQCEERDGVFRWVTYFRDTETGPVDPVVGDTCSFCPAGFVPVNHTLVTTDDTVIDASVCERIEEP